MKDKVIAARAAGAEESRKDDCSRRILVSLLRRASRIADDVLPGRADSRRSMLAMVQAKSTIRLVSMFQH
jgi:hypothetical protein